MPQVLQQIHDEKFHHNSIFYATLIKDEQLCMRMVEFLAANGVDASIQDKLNQTALYYACRDGKVNLADLLVRQGCNVNHVDSNTQTPIFYAAREGHTEVIKRLIT